MTDPDMAEERELRLAGAGDLTLAAGAYGPEEGPGVVFLHGFGQTRHAWDRTARVLAAEGWSVLALDLRGHGESQWADEYHFADFEEDVRLVTRRFDQPPAVIGASMGGILGLLTQADGPIASALCLVDVVPHFDVESGQRVQGFMAEHRDGFPSLDEAAAAVDGFLEHRSRPNKVDGLLRNLRQDETGHYRWKWDPRFASGVEWIADHPGDIHEVAAEVRARMIAAARGLTIPTMLVRGGLSDFVPEDAARAFVELVPHARYVDVAGAGHMIAGDRNDAFADAVVSFLTDARSQ